MIFDQLLISFPIPILASLSAGDYKTGISRQLCYKQTTSCCTTVWSRQKLLHKSRSVWIGTRAWHGFSIKFILGDRAITNALYCDQASKRHSSKVAIRLQHCRKVKWNTHGRKTTKLSFAWQIQLALFPLKYIFELSTLGTSLPHTRTETLKAKTAPFFKSHKSSPPLIRPKGLLDKIRTKTMAGGGCRSLPYPASDGCVLSNFDHGRGAGISK